jgi:PLP dependent protein
MNAPTSDGDPLEPAPGQPAQLRRNLERVMAAVEAATVASGRVAGSVRLIAVSKYVSAAAAAALAELGVRDFGESRPQSLWQKQAALSAWPDIQWHMIGHLQRNKVARTVAHLHWLHSLDSLRLAQALEETLARQQQTLRVLVEVNVTQDTSKTGLQLPDVAPLVENLLQMPHLELRGLMAMSTDGADETLARKEFSQVRELRDALQSQFGPHVQLNELSMGMSGDFAWAIAEGATMIRVGSLLWESPPA